MILSVHAIFGAAVASLIPTHPVIGFSLGFLSHFALDAIPHKDYHLVSVDFASQKNPKLDNFQKKKKKVIRDLCFIFLDALLGVFFAYLFFFNPNYPLIFFFGASGAVLPDFFTFLYVIFKHKSLDVFYNIHIRIIHSKVIFAFHQVVGVFFQLCTVTILITTMFLVKSFF